jgi:monoamine oxidase
LPRTKTFETFLRAWRTAQSANRHRLSTREAIERHDEAQSLSRRSFLKIAGATAAALSPAAGAAKTFAAAPRIAIVGGGLAGLACADRLQAKGYSAVVYEGAARLGGRCFSNRTLVPGMACENGGELIDTAHKTMLGYANEFGLPLESYIKKAGELVYYFQGHSWPEEEIVDQFRAVVARMQPDLRAISGAATFFSHNAADIAFDNTDLATYIAARTSGFPLLNAVLNEAYLAEYGLETWQQSTLNFLGFMRLNKRSKFEPFGVSDERFHLRDGNDGIINGLEDKLRGPIVTGARLTKLARSSSGYSLYFNGSNTPERADAVVLTIPFTVLRNVTLDPSLGLSADKLKAIHTLGYGMNAKTMIAFNGRPWEELHMSNGGVYSDLANVQTTWETNRARSTSLGIITDYASGDRGVALETGPQQVQSQVQAFLSDFETTLPGTFARAATDINGKYIAHLEHWPTSPLALGSYTCYTPGQFTGISALEGQAAGLLKFAGEHADSFYSYQGFMEGACLSGIRAANELLTDIKKGTL